MGRAVQKPLVPYGKKLETLIAGNKVPTNSVYVFVGIDSWRKAKGFSVSHYVLCLPFNTDPENYIWPVKGCSILLVDSSGLLPKIIRKLAYILLSSGALSVHVIRPKSRLVVFRRNLI